MMRLQNAKIAPLALQNAYLLLFQKLVLYVVLGVPAYFSIFWYLM